MGTSADRSWCEQNWFDHLADELILEIFSYLEPEEWIRLRQVCNRWRALTFSKSLWLTGKNVEAVFSTKFPKLFELAHHYIQVAPVFYAVVLCNLSVDQCAEIASQIMHYGPKTVKHLRFYSCVIREDDFFGVLKCLGHSAEHLALERFTILWTEGEKSVFGYLPRLESLAVDMPFIDYCNDCDFWPNQHNLEFASESSLGKHINLFSLRSQLKDLRFVAGHPISSFHNFRRFLKCFPQLNYLEFEIKSVNLGYVEHAHFILRLENACISSFEISAYSTRCFLWSYGTWNHPSIISLTAVFKSVVNLSLSFVDLCSEYLRKILERFPKVSQLTLNQACVTISGRNIEVSHTKGELEKTLKLVRSVIESPVPVKILILKGCGLQNFDDSKLPKSFSHVKVECINVCTNVNIVW